MVLAELEELVKVTESSEEEEEMDSAVSLRVVEQASAELERQLDALKGTPGIDCTHHNGERLVMVEMDQSEERALCAEALLATTQRELHRVKQELVQAHKQIERLQASSEETRNYLIQMAHGQ